MDIGAWLRSLGLSRYETAFSENSIDAEVLPDLTDGDLAQLGVNLGDRKRLLKAIASLGATDPAAKPTRPAPLSSSTDAAERRPITVMFCDLVGSTSLAAKLDAEDWRNLVNAYLDEASTAVTGLRRPCAEEARRRADGALRLSAGAGERRRARRAGPRSPSSARLPSSTPETPRMARRSCPPASASRAAWSWWTRPAKCSAKRRTWRRASKLLLSPGSVLVTVNVQRQVAGLFVAEEQGRARTQGRLPARSSSFASFAPAAAAEGAARGR